MVENTIIPLTGHECLSLACCITSAYHNSIAYNAPEDDGFREEMEELEELAKAAETDAAKVSENSGGGLVTGGIRRR
jgi:hypothetical protein